MRACNYVAPDKLRILDDIRSSVQPDERFLADCGSDGLRLGKVVSVAYAALATTVTVAGDKGQTLTPGLVSIAFGGNIPDSLCDHGALHAAGARDAVPHDALSGTGSHTHAQIDDHLASTDNPHSTTAEQVGAARSDHTHSLGAHAHTSDTDGGNIYATTAETQAGTLANKAVTPATRRQAALSEMRDMLGVFPGVLRPTLNLHAGLVTSDDCPLGSFSRSSVKWRLGPTGLLESVAAGKVAREWNTDGTLLGWLLESQETNYISCSGDITNTTYWDDPLGKFTRSTGQKDLTGGLSGALISASDHAPLRTSLTMASDTGPVVASFFVRNVNSPKMRLSVSETITWGAWSITIDTAYHTVESTAGNIPITDCGAIAYPDGTYRYWLSFNNNNHSNFACDLWFYDYNEQVVAWGVQVERGSYPSSPIVTTNGPVTRPADVWTIPTSAFPFNASEGTFYINASLLSTQTSSSPVSLNDGGITDFIRLVIESGNCLEQVAASGSIQAEFSSGSVSSGTYFRDSLSYAKDDFANVLNSGQVQTDSSGALPAVTQIGVGNTSGYNILNGHIRHLAYFARRLSNSNMQLING